MNDRKTTLHEVYLVSASYCLTIANAFDEGDSRLTREKILQQRLDHNVKFGYLDKKFPQGLIAIFKAERSFILSRAP